MREHTKQPVSITIDIKKRRLRIFKSTLHNLGDPPYIQLLINPDCLVVAIKSISHSFKGDQTHKVSKRTLHSDNCVEICSKSFIEKLIEISPNLDRSFNYRMNGEIVPDEKLAVFSLKGLTRIE
ncbi:hypothetical protein BXO88_04080 [Oribacterium sp. C9]|uniref:hypothetical protein n=1 Tax=Oribacterium sp. C9 TaxID=1943579 RepID=UPI00098EF71D|nr:hypothetical protein [Oribacterium sp. C9]OON87457.1 hypothetical protein BXO88_04080 [Oribacterium sp. C9]